MRLNKFLARAGLASRRKCDQLIESGKVVVNGQITKKYSYNVDSEDVVVCNGVPIDTIPKSRVYLVNKLKGYISTSSDPLRRKKVIDLIKSEDRLFTVGRLDRDTTGTILVTNDGQLANNLMHPRNQIEKIYLVATKVDISRLKYNSITSGLVLDKNNIAYGKIFRLGKKGGLIHWKVILCEGKHHEVKRIFKALGSTVIHLHRESFAGISADNIIPGKYRELKKNEINALIHSNEVIKKD
jgi:pseudouridine synthase